MIFRTPEQKTELCFFAENDTIALGAMKALKEKGYKILPGCHL